MAAPTNILQWNPGKNNQMLDAAYNSDSARTGGASSGVFPAVLANKLFYQCTTVVAALAQTMVNKNYEMQDTDIASLVLSLSNILTKADFGTGAESVCRGNDSRLMPAGSRMWFHMNVAPAGWTIVPNLGDRVLSVAGVSGAYAVAGGGAAGTWSQPAHSHTMSHTHSLSVSLGTHSHCIYRYTQAVSDATPSRVYNSAGNLVNMTTNPGPSGIAWVTQVSGKDYTLPFDAYTSKDSGGSVTGNTGAASSANTGSSYTAHSWRPAANVGIICIKS